MVKFTLKVLISISIFAMTNFLSGLANPFTSCRRVCKKSQTETEIQGFENENPGCSPNFCREEDTGHGAAVARAFRRAVADYEIEMGLKKERRIKKSFSHISSKLLLLGAGQSGKSTFFKQMQILKENYFDTTEQRLEFLGVVNANLLEAMHTVLSMMDPLGIPLGKGSSGKDKEEFNAFYEFFLLEKTFYNKRLPMSLGLNINQLWNDEGVKETYSLAHKYQLNETAKYFLDSAQRICQHEYIPTKRDILHTRTRTTGAVEFSFNENGNIFTIIDVGGQRSQRLKWLHLFDTMDGVIFFASLSGYNLVLEEDGQTNRMLESLRLFYTLTSSPIFAKTPIILFLNKIDLFMDKLKTCPLNVCFPQYGGSNRYESAIQFIEGRFRAHNARAVVQNSTTESNSLSIKPAYGPLQSGVNTPNPTEIIAPSLLYIHRTCATDTRQINFVFKATADFVLESSLHHVALF